jgi:hypothetical protein
MDATWYAVDQHGHVAVFSTGEDGHLPADALSGSLVSDLWGLRHPDTDDADYPGLEEAGRRLGFFYYTFDWPSDPVRPYDRLVTPERPLHVDQLPPHLRKQWKRIRFEGVDFSRSELVQPLEFFACRFWYRDWAAYLCGDGKTVRPIPGREDHFVTLCRELPTEQPDFARGLRFEFCYEGGVAWLCGEGKVVRPLPGQEARFADFCSAVNARAPDWAKDLLFETPGGAERTGEQANTGEE